MTPSQTAFLALHVTRVVYRWQWYFGETQLRAHAANQSATIWRAELDDLLARGLMERGPGVSVVAAPNRLKGATILENGDAT